MTEAFAKFKSVHYKRLQRSFADSEFASWGILHHITDPILNSIPAGSIQQLAILPFQVGICFSQFSYATSYSAYPDSKVNNWRYNVYTEALWQNRSGWEVEGRFDFNGYSGLWK